MLYFIFGVIIVVIVVVIKIFIWPIIRKPFQIITNIGIALFIIVIIILAIWILGMVVWNIIT